ncbi:signal peptidase I [Marinitoga sp. 1197]|uniref:signal peptidase I n=1 Tax=Marinitoga sp. 1197 TaxID=1428449 RepID=UPI0012E05FE5
MSLSLKSKIKKETYEWVNALVYAVIFGTIIRLFVFETMMVPTPSMVPTIQVLDRLFIEKITYDYSKPKLGDIIVFWTPFVDKSAQKQLGAFDKFMDLFAPKKFDGHVKYVKRLVGVPGDTLELVPDSKIWEKLKSDKDFTPPYWLKKIIDYYNGVENVPSSVKNSVAQLYVNGKIPEGFENRYYYIDGIFASKDYYKFMAYPEKYSSDIYRAYSEIRKPMFDLGAFRYYNKTLDYTKYYESVLSKLDLNKVFVEEKGRVKINLPDGFYFFMGDNTTESFDSRYFGIVPEENIIGRPFLRIWPYNRFGSVK